MLRGTQKWITYSILAIIFIFGIAFLAKQIGVTTHLKHNLAQAKTAGIAAGDLRQITHLHNSSAKVFFLSFFSLCLLLTGVIIIMKGIERAYEISEVKEKVRYHLNATTPGVILVVLGSFILSFCTWQVSKIETVYSSRLLDYNNYKVAMEGWQRPAPVPATSNSSASNSEKSKLIEPSADQRSAPIARSGKKKAENIPARKSINKKPAVVKTDRNIARSRDAVRQSDNTTTSDRLRNQGAGTINESVRGPLEPGAVAWAEQFQRKVTIYGYVPTSAEEAQYQRIIGKLSGDYSGALNGDLKWAYSFLRKTKTGYDPKPGEMKKFEEIVTRSVNSSAKNTGRPVSL